MTQQAAIRSFYRESESDRTERPAVISVGNPIGHCVTVEVRIGTTTPSGSLRALTDYISQQVRAVREDWRVPVRVVFKYVNGDFAPHYVLPK